MGFFITMKMGVDVFRRNTTTMPPLRGSVMPDGERQEWHCHGAVPSLRESRNGNGFAHAGVMRKQVAVRSPSVAAREDGPQEDGDPTPLYILGWSVSALVHGAVLAVAAVVTLHVPMLSVPPQKQPFRWEVSLMAAPREEPLSAEGLQASDAVTEAEVPPAVNAGGSAQAAGETDHPQEAPLPETVLAERLSQPSSRPASFVADGAAALWTDRPAWPDPATVGRQGASASLPPPDVESQRDSPRVEVATEPESPMVRQRPEPVFREVITRSTSPDYTWLMEVLRRRLDRVKVYPYWAKASHVEGRVVVQVSVDRDGRLLNPTVEESSGLPVLDHAALESVRAASPLTLDHALDSPSVVMLVPLHYQLE